MDEGTDFSLHSPQVIPGLLLILSIRSQLSTKENFWDIENNNNQQKQPVEQASPTAFLVCQSRCEQGLGLWQTGVIIPCAG